MSSVRAAETADRADKLMAMLEAVVYDIVDARVEEQAEDAVRDVIVESHLEGQVTELLKEAIDDANIKGMAESILANAITAGSQMDTASITLADIRSLVEEGVINRRVLDRTPWWRRWGRSLVQFATPAVTLGPPT